MKKLAFISILLLLTLPSLGQIDIKIDATITGLWELRIGMSPKEAEQAMSRHKMKNTHIVSNLNEAGTIAFYDVVFENTTFSVCLLTFKDERLKEIALIDYFDLSLEGISIEQEKKDSIPGVLIPGSVAQVATTDFGKLVLDMSLLKMKTVLNQYVTPATKISGTFDGESTISIKKISLLGYTFDQCYFNFIDNQLSNITVSMCFDEKTQDPKEFEELLDMLEFDYGERPKSDNNTYRWQDKDKRFIMLSKDLKEDGTKINLSMSINPLDTKNMEVYK